MEFRKVTNKNKEVLTTKEGVELIDLRFEEGDEFIPMYNNVMEKTREVQVNGKTQNITNYTLKCRVKDALGKDVEHRGSTELFVSLTPAQATSLKKKVSEGIELNQNLFVVYKYQSENYGEQLGLGLKKANKPAKTFEEIEKQ